MFFIFGWNHTEVTNYGPVKQERCQNCNNNEIWQLKKISKFFTLFFIPIFPHDSDNIYECPICNRGLKLDKQDCESYKEIAQLNVDCLEKRITEDERLERLNKILAVVNGRQEERNIKAVESSGKWISVVAERSTEELENILTKKRDEYDPAFLVAAENELNTRKG